MTVAKTTDGYWNYLINDHEHKWWAICWRENECVAEARYGSLGNDSYRTHKKPAYSRWDILDRIWSKESPSKGYRLVEESEWRDSFDGDYPILDLQREPLPKKSSKPAPPPEGKVGVLTFLKRRADV